MQIWDLTLCGKGGAPVSDNAPKDMGLEFGTGFGGESVMVMSSIEKVIRRDWH